MTSASFAASGAVGAGAVWANAGAIVVKESVARMVQHSIFDFKDIGFGPPKMVRMPKPDLKDSKQLSACSLPTVAPLYQLANQKACIFVVTSQK